MAGTNSKRFPEWLELKAALDEVGRIVNISEGQVWWAAIGENVGVEINGKSKFFSRPVLIYKKLSKFGFMGVPTTSQKHEGSWYVSFKLRGKTNYAVLAQARVLSVSRLYRDPIGSISPADLEKIRRGFAGLYCYKGKNTRK